MKAKGRKTSVPSPSARPAPTSWEALSPLIAAAVALVTYAPSLFGGFVYDDGEVVLRNTAIRNLADWHSILRYEPARPLLTLTWALNYALAGEAPWPYHLVNILVHCGNAALLASIFLVMARRLPHKDPAGTALFASCLFAASPMAAETVAYVASRSSALQALFALGSLRIALSVLEGAEKRRLVLAVFLFLLAVATKEEAAAVPLLLFLLDYFFVSGRDLRELGKRFSIHALFLSFLPLGLLGRRLVTLSWLPPPAIPRSVYILTEWAAFPLYFFRALIPLDPALYRHHHPAALPPGATTLAFSLLTAVMFLLAVLRRRQWPAWSFAVLCLAAGLLPSSSLVPLNEMVVDHRAYLGSLGVAFAAASALWKPGRGKAASLVLLALVLRSVSYEWVLADPVRAWEDAVSRAPESGDALCALAESYAARNDPRAEALFLRATRLDPGNYRYWANLGVYDSERGRTVEAISALEEAARLNPREATVLDYLGQLLVALGRKDEAATRFEAAIAAQPTFAQAYLNLAALSLDRGEAARAKELLEKAAPLASDDEEAAKIAALRAAVP